MAKKNKTDRRVVTNVEKSPVRAPLLSRIGKRIVLSGIASVVLGFILLTFTDPAGQNWASILSPLFLVGGYTAIGVGLVVKDPSAESSPPPLKP